MEEEPSITSEIAAFDGSVFEAEEFLEKPELAATLPSVAESEIKAESKPVPRTAITNYSVSSGDTLSTIARRYGLTVKTIAEVNNLSSVHQIKPGQTLTIPPADGLIYTVQKGDTLSKIVKKYQGNLAETIKYNSENLQIGQKIVVIGGRTPVPSRSAQLASARNTVTREGRSAEKVLAPGGRRNNGYPWGWCTWYAAYRRNVPQSWGNAGRWLSSARAAGYATGFQPQAGAIIVTSESWAGHVGYVEGVQGNSMTISEMNYEQWGVISKRVISTNNLVIKGYIY